MDPNTTLIRMRELSSDILRGHDEDNPYPYGLSEMLRKGEELAELIQALDEWMVKGEFIPRDWRPF